VIALFSCGVDGSAPCPLLESGDTDTPEEDIPLERDDKDELRDWGRALLDAVPAGAVRSSDHVGFEERVATGVA